MGEYEKPTLPGPVKLAAYVVVWAVAVAAAVLSVGMCIVVLRAAFG